jgi:hypothetical protein
MLLPACRLPLAGMGGACHHGNHCAAVSPTPLPTSTAGQSRKSLPNPAPPPSHLPQGRYVSLGICKTPSDWRNLSIIAFLLGGFLGVNSLIKSVNQSTKVRKQKKALAELEKEE